MVATSNCRGKKGFGEMSVKNKKFKLGGRSLRAPLYNMAALVGNNALYT
jgi:hypothetical protein